MYQVLYRKWRPRSFNDVVGQNHVTSTLKNEINTGKVSHAYLFIGSRGTGKTTCAKILAKAVNCLAPKDGDPCGDCELCKGIDNASVMDIVEMDAASNNSVNDIRSLCEELAFTPAVAKYRVYIIDEVHMLSQGAFNALLKTLEEPPEHVIFILATTEAHKIPATILSRCQRFEFHRIPSEDICARLQMVAEAEGVSLTDDAAMLIAKLSDGALRDALSILDKCMGASNTIDQKIVTDIVGIAPKDRLFDLSEAIVEKDAAKILEIIADLSSNSKDMAFLCEELIDHMRTLMLVMTMGDPGDAVAVTVEELQRYKLLSGRFFLDQVINIMKSLIEARNSMASGGDKRTILEATLVKIITDVQIDVDTLVKRMDKLEKMLESRPLMSEQSMHAQKTMQSVAKRQVEPSESHIDLDALIEKAKPFEQWSEVLSILKKYSPTAAVAFADSSAYVSGGFVLIDTTKEMALEILRKSTQREKIKIAIAEVTGKTYNLGPYKRKENKQQVQEEDPLLVFANEARQAGVSIKIDNQEVE